MNYFLTVPYMHFRACVSALTSITIDEKAGEL